MELSVARGWFRTPPLLGLARMQSPKKAPNYATGAEAHPTPDVGRLATQLVEELKALRRVGSGHARPLGEGEPS